MSATAGRHVDRVAGNPTCTGGAPHPPAARADGAVLYPPRRPVRWWSTPVPATSLLAALLLLLLTAAPEAHTNVAVFKPFEWSRSPRAVERGVSQALVRRRDGLEVWLPRPLGGPPSEVDWELLAGGPVRPRHRIRLSDAGVRDRFASWLRRR